MNKDDAEIIRKSIETISDKVVSMVAPLGLALATASEHATIISGGVVQKETGRKFFVVLATNDSAVHLEARANEHADALVMALKGVPGISAIDCSRPRPS